MKLKEMPVLPLVMIAVMFAVGAWVYPSLPDRIPMHWNAAGQIDRWEPTSLANVFGEPLSALGIYALFMLMPLIDPKRANLYRSKPIYFLVLDLTVALFLLMFLGGLAAAFYTSLPIDRLALGGVGMMLVVIGNYMGRVKLNWTLGVRSAWTLSDDTVWTRTNRLGGRLFAVAGALSIMGTLLPPPWGFVILMASALAILPVTFIYSMLLYRRLHPEDAGRPKPDAAR
ncbi:MAG: DUF1648 domain-containing protein [Coriobacteriia bacterium]|nr:DUF1648 domain-containing protein [Coriobacteriia bacterium]